MPANKLLYLASLITFTFGAVAFSVLTVYYWRQRQAGLRKRRTVFPVFTAVCAAALILNLVLRIGGDDAPPSLVTALSIASALLTDFLPALLLHLIVEEERRGRRLLPPFYGVAFLAAAGHVLNDADLWDPAWADRLELVPAAMLGAAGLAGLALQAQSRRKTTPMERRHRLCTRALLVLLAINSAAAIAAPGPLSTVTPDYLLLAFFCVTLYYKERLVFFDLLIKHGAFFLGMLIVLTAFFVAYSRYLVRLPGDWSASWTSALFLAPLGLLAPWAYARLSLLIDRLWLRRRYSPADAEREFIAAVQAAAGEEELRARASASLGEIFQSTADVQFSAQAPEPIDLGLRAGMEQRGASVGSVAVAPRPDSIPFLSDDHRLFQSLVRTLAVVLENVRFREEQRRQQEREQQLRWLASRAELKALRAQINPHFLFNALNSIAGLIGSNPRLADDTIEQLAQVFRYTLNKSDAEWVRLDEEIDFVRAYLNVERARFGNRLQVNFHVDHSAAAVPIPAMTIQPLVENAVKHGVSAVARPGVLQVRATMDAERLCIAVLDNGPGFPPGFLAGANGHGLRNVMERISGYYGDSATLACDNAADGACVRLEVPVLVRHDAYSNRRR